MSKYLIQTMFDYYLERNKVAWHPIAGSRWEVKREDAERFLDKYARFRLAKKLE